MSKKVISPTYLANRANMGLPVNNDSDFKVIQTQFIDNLGVLVTMEQSTPGGVLQIQGAMERDGVYVDIPFDPAFPQPGTDGSFFLNLNQYPFPILWLGYVPGATATVAASVAVQDITYTARELGSNGNAIMVDYVDPGVPDSALQVTVSGPVITVSLETDGSSVIVSTADEVLEAIETSEPADALVEGVISGTGTNVQTANSQTLMGGDGDTGYLTIQVCGKEI